MLEERLKRLEASNRRLRRAFSVAVLAVMIVFLVGQGKPPAKELVARELRIRDAKGTTRCRLFVDHNGARLSLGDANGKPVFKLTAGDDGEGFFLIQPSKERGGLSMIFSPKNSILALMDRRGNRRIMLSVSEIRGRAELALKGRGGVPFQVSLAAEDGAARELAFYDRDGSPRSSLRLTGNGSALMEFLRADGTTKWRSP